MTDRRMLLVAHTGRTDIAITAGAAANRLHDAGIELVSLAGEIGVTAFPRARVCHHRMMAIRGLICAKPSPGFCAARLDRITSSVHMVASSCLDHPTISTTPSTRPPTEMTIPVSGSGSCGAT